VCFGGAIAWESCKQPTTAASTMDAEYQACWSATREALSLRKLLRELALLCRVLWPEKASVILCDNKAAVSLCSDRKETKRAKHIDIVHHFARDHVETGDVKVVYCRSEENVSDYLTKALSRPLFESGLDGWGMVQ
jgi:23S rRNA U2552 (ribose-2'-O)-methylase RlmE/FtsJ